MNNMSYLKSAITFSLVLVILFKMCFKWGQMGKCWDWDKRGNSLDSQTVTRLLLARDKWSDRAP